MLAAMLPCVGIFLLLSRWLPKPVRWRGVMLFLLGTMTIIPVGLTVFYLERWGKGHFTSYFIYSLYEVFVLAAIPEELSRYLVLRWLLPRLLRIEQCLLLGCLTGLGFGGIEYLLFTYSGGWEACWQRLITSLPFHTAAGGIVGYWIGKYLHGQVRWSGWGLAITIPLHAFNNFNLRNFESIDMNSVDEPQHNLWQQILFSHWPSNLLVTCSTVALCFIFYRRASNHWRAPEAP